MKQDDIDKILQQYGTNRRQQQSIADQLQHLARKQRQRRVLAVCTVLLLATAVWTLRLLSFQQPSPLMATHQPQAILVAQQHTVVSNHPTNRPSAHPTTRPTASHYLQPQNSTNHPQTNQAINPSTAQDSSTYHPVILSSIQPTESYQQTNTSTPQHISISTNQDTSKYQNSNPPNHINTSTYQHINKSTPSTSSRFRITASIGASTLSSMSPLSTYADNDNLSYNALESYTTVVPQSTWTAQLDVSYAIPVSDKKDIQLGIGLSGHAHQSSFQPHQYVATNPYSTDGFNYIDIGGPSRTHSTFSLFADLPVSYSLHPHGTDALGWIISLTPSHSIAIFDNHLEDSYANTPIINPWRLTLGLGVSLPRGLIRRIDLTANLLPLYTTLSFHEFGIQLSL